VQKSAAEVLVLIFWDQDSILLIDYLPKGQTKRGVFIISAGANEDILKEKCHGKFTKGILFLHENVPPHQALATLKKMAYLGFQCLDHPPYSLDLAP
jgi:hypothetical protein